MATWEHILLSALLAALSVSIATAYPTEDYYNCVRKYNKNGMTLKVDEEGVFNVSFCIIVSPYPCPWCQYHPGPP